MDELAGKLGTFTVPVGPFTDKSFRETVKLMKFEFID